MVLKEDTSATPAEDTVDTTATVVEAPDANNPANTSVAEDTDAKEPVKATQDIVRDVLRPKTAAPAGESSNPTETKSDKSTPTTDEGDKPKIVDDKQLPFHNHPRWKEVTSDNKRLTQEVTRLQPAADQYQKVEQYMAQHNLTAEDTGKMFLIGALIKAQDPRAITELESVLDELKGLTGHTLPEDLRKAVDEGEMTEERAKELSTTRAAARRANEQRDATTAHAHEVQSQQEVNDRRQAINAAVGNWETQKAATDPDFARKQTLVQEFATAATARERAKGKTTFTAEESVAILEQSYKRANEQLKAFVPPKPGVKAPLRASSSATPAAANTQGGAKTIDIVRQSILASQ